MKKNRKYYKELFKQYPDLVTVLQFREMLGGVCDSFARSLIQQKYVKSFFIKPYYYGNTAQRTCKVEQVGVK